MVLKLLKLDKEGRVIFGAKEILKKLRNNELEEIYLASNCKKEFENQIEALASANKVKLKQTKKTSEELQEACKKLFKISAAGVLKKTKDEF